MAMQSNDIFYIFFLKLDCQLEWCTALPCRILHDFRARVSTSIHEVPNHLSEIVPLIAVEINRIVKRRPPKPRSLQQTKTVSERNAFKTVSTILSSGLVREKRQRDSDRESENQHVNRSRDLEFLRDSERIRE